jgi:AcrR family transcriptional regulator
MAKHKEVSWVSRETMIIEKAIELFARNGIDATSVQDITDACGISKGAFYLSFKSKEELLNAIVDYFMRDIVARIDAVLSQPVPVRDRLYDYYLLNFKIFFEYSTFMTIYMREHVRPVNEEIAKKINEFEKITDESLLTLIDEILGEKLELRYDLLISIKSFVVGYTGYMFTHPRKYEVEHLAHVLVERTLALANHHEPVFITHEMWNSTPKQMTMQMPTLEMIEMLVQDALNRYRDDELLKETLQLLLEEIQSDKPRPAMIKGLLGNLQAYPDMSWLIYCVQYVERHKRKA